MYNMAAKDEKLALAICQGIKEVDPELILLGLSGSEMLKAVSYTHLDKIRIGIVGYGNIGRGVEKAIARNEDMELTAVFTRRDPSGVKIATEGVEVKHIDDMLSMKDKIDVMMLCGGSATDLPVMGPQIVQNFNTIDSFDTHARIPEYFANVDKAAKSGGHVGIISVGWDPGMFSLNRLYAESILVQGSTYTCLLYTSRCV